MELKNHRLYNVKCKRTQREFQATYIQGKFFDSDIRMYNKSSLIVLGEV